MPNCRIFESTPSAIAASLGLCWRRRGQRPRHPDEQFAGRRGLGAAGPDRHVVPLQQPDRSCPLAPDADGPDHSQAVLKITPTGSPDLLETSTDLGAPGPYVVRWQVLAVDGHITRGDVPFTVTDH